MAALMMRMALAIRTYGSECEDPKKGIERFTSREKEREDLAILPFAAHLMRRDLLRRDDYWPEVDAVAAVVLADLGTLK
jgi:hypothetical protein